MVWKETFWGTCQEGSGDVCLLGNLYFVCAAVCLNVWRAAFEEQWKAVCREAELKALLAANAIHCRPWMDHAAVLKGPYLSEAPFEMIMGEQNWSKTCHHAQRDHNGTLRCLCELTCNLVSVCAFALKRNRSCSFIAYKGFTQWEQAAQAYPKHHCTLVVITGNAFISRQM